MKTGSASGPDDLKRFRKYDLLISLLYMMLGVLWPQEGTWRLTHAESPAAASE